MAKIAFWVLLAFVLKVSGASDPFQLQASFATPVEIKSDHSHLQQKLVKVRDETIKSVESLSLDNVEKRRAIVSNASEFAYKLEKAINKIFQNFVRVNERDSDRNLPQLALRLNNIVHQVQDALITKPAKLQVILNENVHQVYVISERFRQMLQHYEENVDSEEMRSDIKDIINKLVDAMHQLQIRGPLHHQNHDEIVTFHQKFGNRIIDTLNKILSRDRATLDQLVKTGAVFADFLNHIIDYLREEFAQFHGYDRKAFDEVFTGLIKIRSHLDGVLSKLPLGDMKQKVEDIITQIRLTVHDFDIQVQKLTTIGKGFEDSHLYSSLINCVKNVIADSIHAEQRVLWKLEDIVREHAK